MNNKKQLIQQRNDLIEEAQHLVQTIEAEKRSLSDEEATRFDEIRSQIQDMDKTLGIIDQTRSWQQSPEQTEAGAGENSFERFMRGETTALTAGDNGSVIPNKIAGRIITRVKELSPILQNVTIVSCGGDLSFPAFDDTNLSADYVDEMEDPAESGGAFSVTKLTAFAIAALMLVSKEMIVRTDFDVVGFVIEQVALSLAEKLEYELINGTGGKMTGALSANQTVTATSATAITADEIIDLEMAIPQRFVGNAAFYMHKSTLKKLRKLKTTDGEYLLNRDLNTPFGWSLLGHPVYVTESMPVITANTGAICYGDMTGIVLKLAQDIELQILKEKYAPKAIGVVATCFVDSKVVEEQKLAVLKMAAGQAQPPIEVTTPI